MDHDARSFGNKWKLKNAKALFTEPGKVTRTLLDLRLAKECKIKYKTGEYIPGEPLPRSSVSRGNSVSDTFQLFVSPLLFPFQRRIDEVWKRSFFARRSDGDFFFFCAKGSARERCFLVDTRPRNFESLCGVIWNS